MTQTSDISRPHSLFAENDADSDESAGFMPSSVSAREQRAREHTDRTINEFIEKFTQKDFFPPDSETLLFALLPQLSEWPADLQLKIDNEQGDTIATYLKGSDPSVIESSISVVQDRYGEYAALTFDSAEVLFSLIMSQLPEGTSLGFGGDFPGSSSIEGRIVTMREQLVELLKSERTDVFEALQANDDSMKCQTGFGEPNRFLPLWKLTSEWPILKKLRSITPELTTGRLFVLLERFPLSEEQEQTFLDKDVLPEFFIEAFDQTLDECCKDRSLDATFNTRTYNADADTLAISFAQGILKNVLGYDLSIVEVDAEGQYISDPELSATAILLLQHGEGKYSVKNFNDDEVYSFGGTTDSFYLAIASVLQPHERLTLGMQSDNDVAGFRSMLGNAAAAANGGWFDVKQTLQADEELLPDWMKNASTAEKFIWNATTFDYRQALIEVQTPALIKLNQYLDIAEMHGYVRGLIRNRLDFDLGLQLDPDEITVESTDLEWFSFMPVYNPGSKTDLTPEGEPKYKVKRRSLVELCLENLSFTDVEFVFTARVLDKDDNPIKGLSGSYMLSLVRELNVGASYTKFLKQRLLTSSLAQWNREKYAQVMDAQMRVDVIEAKMAKDFLDDGLPPSLANRTYKWVMAVLDNSNDSEASTLVEGHRITTKLLKFNDLTPIHTADFFGIPSELAEFDGLELQGLLMISPESEESVPSVVLYTPSAPDSVQFREYGSVAEMQTQLLSNPDLFDYLSTRVPGIHQASLRKILGNQAARRYLDIQVSPLSSESIYDASYENGVARVIEQVEAQTTTTAEANWQTAWNIASSVAELVIEFAPFHVKLPIAAARSIFAISKGARAASNGDGTAVTHFAQAGFLLLDGFGGKRQKRIYTPSGRLHPTRALTTSPEGLTLRTDGVYNGVFEKINEVGPSNFYAQSAGKTFPIRYDTGNSTWRVIDPRRPDAYYQMPIRIDGQGQWNYDNIGLHGGAPKRVNPVRQAAEDRRNAAAEGGAAGPARAVNAAEPHNRLRIDLDGFFESDKFIAAENKFVGEKVSLRKQVEKAVELYSDRGKGRFHPSAGGYTIDLPNLGGSKGGPGKWRLQMLPFFNQQTGILEPNAVRAFDITDPH